MEVRGPAVRITGKESLTTVSRTRADCSRRVRHRLLQLLAPGPACEAQVEGPGAGFAAFSQAALVGDAGAG